MFVPDMIVFYIVKKRVKRKNLRVSFILAEIGVLMLFLTILTLWDGRNNFNLLDFLKNIFFLALPISVVWCLIWSSFVYKFLIPEEEKK